MMPNTVSNLKRPFSSTLREPASTDPLSHATSASEIEDVVLLQRVQKGDQAAMAEIFDRHSKKVYSAAWHILKDDGYAEDVLQEIFFKLWQNPGLFESARGPLRPWLLAIAKNRAIDFLRRARHTEPVEEENLVCPSNVVLAAETSVLIEKVQKALKDLPEKQRESMYLAFFEELSHAEIAERTGEPLGTIKTRIRLALIRLRKVLAA